MYDIKKQQNDFKLWCKSNRLRLKIDEDNTPIAITRSKKNPKDHLFEGFENGDIGLHISRKSSQILRNWIIKLEMLGAGLRQRGDIEANFRLKMDDAALTIAKLLKIKKKDKNTSSTENVFKKKEAYV